MEDWRLTVTLADRGQVRHVLVGLHELEVEGQTQALLDGRVTVSSQDERIFVYAASREGADVARTLVAELVQERSYEATYQLDRWHDVEQDWQDASVPLPDTAHELAEERQRRMAEETAQSWATGEALWEVRLDLPTHPGTVELAAQLRDEGYGVVRRYRTLLVGASNEDEAKELAERLRTEAPAGTEIHVEPSGAVVWHALPNNPFAVLGGLAG